MAAKPKAPLAENKKITNESDTLGLKKQKGIKTIALKQTMTKMNTDYKEKQKLPQAHRAAIDRIFTNQKESNSISFYKKKEQSREVPKMEGAARYAFDDKVGSGTFGIVHKARDKKTL